MGPRKKGHNKVGKGNKIERVLNHYGAPNLCGGRRMTAGIWKSVNNDTNAFFNTIHLLPKDFRFKHGGAKHASCPRIH